MWLSLLSYKRQKQNSQQQLLQTYLIRENLLIEILTRPSTSDHDAERAIT